MELTEFLNSIQVAISTSHGGYPSEPPYSPGALYSEYSFGSDALAEKANHAYEGVREALRLLKLDEEHYGQRDWNPLGEIIQLGNTVVLKPNFIRDFRETQPDLEDCVITHGAVIRAALDYVYIALKGKGRIIIADAPQSEADFEVIRRIAGLDEIQKFYCQYANFEVEVYDLRPERAKKVDGVIVGHERLPGDPSGYVKVNLGNHSMFAEVEHLCHLLYGSEYDTSEIRRHHTNGVHEYLISRTIIEADCVINLPKLKTHKKTGITVCMKNLVGINGNKNWLPHHRIGTPSQGGDQFADDGIRHRLERKAMGCFRRLFPLLGSMRGVLSRPLKIIGKSIFGDTNTDTIRSGNWYGNDTTWRMVIDLNRILMYADRNGNLQDRPARNIFNIVDGIIGGEGNGPLDPTPKPAGVIIAGENPVDVDLVCARLMRFDYKKIPLLCEAMVRHSLPVYSSKYDDVICRSSEPQFDKPLAQFNGVSLAFKPHFGWQDHIEKSNNVDIASPDFMDEWIIEYNEDNISNEQNYVEIVFLGDVALAGEVGDAIQQYGSDFLFKNIPVEFFDVDILCFNLECCLSNRGKAWEPKPFPLRGLPEFLSIFPKGRCKYIANVANNHFLDYGEDAALDTLEALRTYDVQHFGLTGSAGQGKYIIVRTRAGSVGLIGFAPSAHSLPKSNCVNLTAESALGMASQVNALKQQSDVVIASLHQGVEDTRCVDRYCRGLAHRLVDAGADCIVCHHPHIIQGIENYKGAHIFHSIGNFVMGSDFQRRASARKSLTLRLLLCNKKLHKIRVEPFIIMDSCQPRPATERERQQIRVETEALSSIFESKLRLNINYLKCAGIRTYDRASSLYEMMRQQGVFTATKYYSGRAMSKAKRRIRSMFT